MWRRRLAKSYNEQLAGFIRAYQKLHPGPVAMHRVAVWACEEGL